MKKGLNFRGIVHAARNFVVFFALVAFVITCTLMLFTTTLQNTIGRDFTREEITAAAKASMNNVVLISLLFASVDALRRRLTVDRPVKQITDAAERIMQGDFNARIAAIHGAGAEGFNEIAIAVNKMAEELGSVETLRSDFIANVSHELKTPLAVMHNYGTLLQQPELEEEKRLEYARAVSDGARRLADMVSNILKLNRLENQRIFPQAAEYDLGEQLCECLLLYESVWEKKDIEIETWIEDDVRIKADGELLKLVWSNLFSNAFKFTPPGGKVSVSMHSTQQHAVVRVTDSGCGMSPQVGAHIFEKFYQGDSSHATEGNGLGLALVKRVVDIMQGELSVESAVGAGSSFTVRIRRG